MFLFDLKLFIFNKTALHLAVEKENTEMVKILLTNNNLDINVLSIYFNILNRI